MLKEIAEQPAAVADTLLGHFVDGRIVLDEQRLDRPGAARDRQGLRRRLRHGLPLRAAGQVRHRALDPAARSRSRWPASSATATRCSTAARWWSRSPSPARPPTRSRRSGTPRSRRPRCWRSATPTAAQIPRESDAVLYTRAGPGDRRRVDQDLPGADRRELPRRAGAGAGPRHQVPRRDRARVRRAGGDARPDRAGAGAAWSRSRELAQRFAQSQAVLFLGRHVGYPVALEGALKLKELAYMHAEGFAAGELKHGPIALIEDGLPVIVVMPSPKGAAMLHPKMLSNIREIQARGALTIVIAEEGDDTVRPVRRSPDRDARGVNAFPAAAVDRSRCRCSPPGSRRPAATTSTSRATWPSPSPSSRREFQRRGPGRPTACNPDSDAALLLR